MEIVNIGNVSKDRFRMYSNKLLNECFILKNCEDTRQCYYFIAREKELFSAYFEYLGYDVVINEEFGIICLNNRYGTGRIRLKMQESMILLLLRIIYIDERKKLKDDIIISLDEIYDRYYSLREKRLSRTDMRSAMGLMKRYNIIRNLDADMGNPDTRIQIYPSVILAIDSAELNKIYESTMQKLDTYKNGGETDENKEDSDETETD